MSHQSGIQASQELLQAFNDAVHNNDVRILKMSIVEESLVLANTVKVSGTWQDDFPQVIAQFEDKIPCYVAFRLDEKGAQGFNWVFFCFVPDHAYVRDKMLYASTRASLRKALGDYYFSDEMYGTDKNEFTLEGYNKHRKSVTSAPALTQREEEIQRMRKEESGADIGVTTKKAHVHGVFFPATPQAEAQLEALRNGTINYLQLAIDTEKESIELITAKQIGPDDITSLTPNDVPRYHFFRYRHAFEDNTIESLIFIYSCPMNSKVKERMLYSSCKASILAHAAEIGLDIAKNSEISEAGELNEAFIFEELHPKKVDEKKTFKKPMRPGKSAPRKPGASASNDDVAGDE